MKKILAIAAAVLVILLSFSSCTDNVTNNYDTPKEEEGGTGAPDVNVISSSYSFGVVHISRIDTTVSSGSSNYRYLIDMNFVLDKPENRSQINKMVIVNEAGFGWEFYQDELESFYSDSLKGYSLKNLNYIMSSNVQTAKFALNLYSVSNETNNSYIFITTPSFIFPNVTAGQWYTTTQYQINFGIDRDLKNWNADIIWLNSGMQEISRKEITASDLVYGLYDPYLLFSDMPDDAYFFYVDISGQLNNQQSYFKSNFYRIAQRYPSNIQIFEGAPSINFNNVFTSENKEYLILSPLNSSNGSIYIYDFDTMALLNSISLNFNLRTITYSESDHKLYMTNDGGKIYSSDINGTTLEVVGNFGERVNSFLVIDKFIIANIGYDIVLLNMNNDSLSTIASSFNYVVKVLYNKELDYIYCLNNYGYSIRFRLDPYTGSITNLTQKYFQYSLELPIVFYPDGSKIVSRNGYIFNCSPDYENDMTYSGNIGETFTSIDFSGDNTGVVLLSGNYNYNEINIYSAINNNFITTINDFFGYPKHVVVKGDVVKVFSGQDYYSSYYKYAEIFSYSELISKGVNSNLPNEKLTIYPMKKLR